MNGEITKITELLSSFLLLERLPAGISAIDDKLSDREVLFKEPHSPIYFCSALSLATRGYSFLMNRKSIRCTAATRNLGLSDLHDFDCQELAEKYYACGLYSDCEAARKMLERTFAGKSVKAIAIGSLSAFKDIIPDAIIVVSTPGRIMRIVQALNFTRGIVDSIEFHGMHGACFELAANSLFRNEFSLSLFCSGARHFGMFSENEMGCAFPARMLEEILEGLVETSGPCEENAAKKRIIERLRENNLEEFIDSVLKKPYFF